MTQQRLNLYLATATLLLASGTAMAANFTIRGALVDRIMVNSGPATSNYGGCMVYLRLPTTTPATTWPTACGTSPWVTLSCTGTFAINAVQAYRALDQAQLALAANKRVDVYFTDSKKHNGHCFASRIDVIK
jgi:hypothetical protein